MGVQTYGSTHSNLVVFMQSQRRPLEAGVPQQSAQYNPRIVAGMKLICMPSWLFVTFKYTLKSYKMFHDKNGCLEPTSVIPLFIYLVVLFHIKTNKLANTFNGLSGVLRNLWMNVLQY